MQEPQFRFKIEFNSLIDWEIFLMDQLTKETGSLVKFNRLLMLSRKCSSYFYDEVIASTIEPRQGKKKVTAQQVFSFFSLFGRFEF